MTILKTAVKGGLAALVVAVMTAGAYAWPAAATTALNVRAGPGTQFQVVDVLQRNERVEVDYCRGSWCFVQTRSAQGWASASYLNRIAASPRPPAWQRPPSPPAWQRPAPPRPPAWHRPNPPYWSDWDQPRRPNPPRGSSVNACFDGPNGYICFGR